MRCRALTIFASAAGDGFCVASPLIASVPQLAVSVTLSSMGVNGGSSTFGSAV